MFQGKIGDSPSVQKTVSMVTQISKKHNWDKYTSAMVGNRARELAEEFDDMAGKTIAKAVAGEADHETEKKVSSFFYNFCTKTGLTIENVMAGTEKIAKSAIK